MKAALVFLTFLFSQVAAPDRIADVQIRGNRRIPTDTIKFNMQTKTGDTLNRDIIRRDVKTLYALGFFDDIRVDEEESPTGLIIMFVVKEKPTVRSIEYKGLNSITKSEVLDKFKEKKVGLSVESPYDGARVKKAEVIIRQMLAEKGRQDATVEAKTEYIPPNAIGVTFEVDEGPKVTVAKIDIEGNEVFSSRQLKRAMKLIKEGMLNSLTGKNTYHELKLADDITRIRMFYADHGYVRANILDPVVEVKPTKVYRTLPLIKPPFPWGLPLPFAQKTVNRYYITIKVEENHQYRIGDVKVSGNEEFTADQIRSLLGLIPGQIYNETLLRKGFENLKKLYGSRGYINFTPVPVQDLDEEKKVVNLTINIDEDRQFYVNRIAFSGNSTTRDKVIRREVMVEEGQIFNSALWDLSLLRLNQLGYFEEIKNEDAQIKPSPTENKVDIDLKVKEKGRNSIGFNGGVSGIGGSFVGLNYSTNNFMGLGETMAVTLEGGTRQSQYVFSFTEPYLANRPISTGFSLFATKFQYDQAREVFGLDPSKLPAGLGLENRLNFSQNHGGFNLTTSYPARVFHRLGLTYQLDNTSTSWNNPATQEYFAGIARQERENFVQIGSFTTFHARRLTPSYTYNTTNNPISPTRGRAFTGSLEFTGGFLGGNVQFYRPTFEYRAYKPVNNGRNALAMRAIVSYVQSFSNTSVPFYERFFVGGDFDIRGFDFRTLSPISFITRTLNVPDSNTGKLVARPFDDIVYVGGDTEGVFNLEYRIPIIGPVTLAPFMDAGNAWVFKKGALVRQVVDSQGNIRTENAQFLPGTNSGIRMSTGLEVQVVMPVINAPFRLVFALNPMRIDRAYQGPVTGIPFSIHQPGHDFKFTVGRTF